MPRTTWLDRLDRMATSASRSAPLGVRFSRKEAAFLYSCAGQSTVTRMFSEQAAAAGQTHGYHRHQRLLTTLSPTPAHLACKEGGLDAPALQEAAGVDALCRQARHRHQARGLRQKEGTRGWMCGPELRSEQTDLQLPATVAQLTVRKACPPSSPPTCRKMWSNAEAR